jgi:hypothetical protein
MVLNLNATETEVDQLRARIQETRQKTLRNRADVPKPEIRSTPIDDISRQIRIYAIAWLSSRVLLDSSDSLVHVSFEIMWGYPYAPNLDRQSDHDKSCQYYLKLQSNVNIKLKAMSTLTSNFRAMSTLSSRHGQH